MTPTVYLQDPDVTLWHGDVLDVLRELPVESVHMACTSPPFYGLRDYGVPGQIGLEPTPDEWVARLVEVFREVRRVLRKDGTLWVEIGDSYNSQPRLHYGDQGKGLHRGDGQLDNLRGGNFKPWEGAKAKDLIGAPWLLAFAMRADGWYLRSEIIWSKPNPMPESVTDRPTTSHSRVFLFAKSKAYYYDAEAIREPNSEWSEKALGGRWVRQTRNPSLDRNDGNGKGNDSAGSNYADKVNPAGRNRRSVWEIPTQPYPEAHFATWPEKLCEPMILAGTSETGVCPECGAPWERVVESEQGRYEGWERNQADGSVLNASRPTVGGTVPSYKPGGGQTLGWQQVCGCGLSERHGLTAPGSFAPVPATVLDPFAGSGTTAYVARRLGRRSVGIDLSAEYLELAAKRLAQQSLLAVES